MLSLFLYSGPPGCFGLVGVLPSCHVIAIWTPPTNPASLEFLGAFAAIRAHSWLGLIPWKKSTGYLVVVNVLNVQKLSTIQDDDAHIQRGSCSHWKIPRFT